MASPIITTRGLLRVCARCRLKHYPFQPLATTTPTMTTTISSLSLRPSPAHHPSLRPFASMRALSSSSTPPNPPNPPQNTIYGLFPESLPAGPPPQGPFAIDTRALRLEFLRLQAKHHPDTQPADQRVAAEASSARLNGAYRTLIDPLLRAQYLLQLHSIDVANDENARVTAEEDGEVLMTVMEAWEDIEAAEREADLEAIRERNETRVSVCERRLGELFAKEDLEGARKETVRLRYWRNVREALHNWDGESGEGKGSPVVH